MIYITRLNPLKKDLEIDLHTETFNYITRYISGKMNKWNSNIIVEGFYPNGPARLGLHGNGLLLNLLLFQWGVALGHGGDWRNGSE